MILEEEKNKYILIKEKLIDYRKNLSDSLMSISNILDPLVVQTLTSMYGRMINLYEKNKSKPYFAKIVFNTEENEEITAYIGRIGFTNIDESDIIIDWRAPISELYYNSDIGKTSYTVDDNIITGELKLKRQIEFKNGEIVSVKDINNAMVDDELLQPYLYNTAENRLKNIVATIQKEQDLIIRLPLSQNIIVQGIAGSGKTTVALHRLSYLIYNNREKFKPESYFIISPNKVFKNYIFSLLEDLDADLAKSFSYEEIVKNFIGNKYNILNKQDQYDFLIKNNIPTNYLLFKGSKQFIDLLNSFLLKMEENYYKNDLVFSGITLLSANSMYNEYLNFKRDNWQSTYEIFCKRIAFLLQNDENFSKMLLQKLKDNKITLNKKLELEKIISSNNIKKILKPLNTSIFEIYKSFINNLDENSEIKDIKILKEQTLKNLNKNILSYDDLGAILFIARTLNPCEEFSKIKNVLIDESQDFSYLQFYSLSKIFSNSTFSIFGDISQAIYSYQSIENWEEISPLFDNAELIELNKSYRTTIEITENANETLKLLGINPANNVLRHGEKVDYHIINLNKEFIEGLIKEFQNKKYSTLAIICKDEEEVLTATNMLKDYKINIYNENTMLDNSSDISILTVTASKGLEFDEVIIFNNNSYNNSILDLKKLYVAKTRALHKLVILSDDKQ